MLDPVLGITPMPLGIERDTSEGRCFLWLCFSYFQVANQNCAIAEVRWDVPISSRLHTQYAQESPARSRHCAHYY